jgi:hypothetical protein
MADPWTIPPKPLFGDATVCKVAMAKTRALNSWEAVEDAFAALNARFGAAPNYGEGSTFTRRLANLEESSCPYFVKHCRQSIEGELRQLIGHARKMADRRNDIAHGMVAPYSGFPAESIGDITMPTRFALSPSKYDIKRQRFVYSADQINAFAISFSVLMHEIQEFTRRLP